MTSEDWLALPAPLAGMRDPDPRGMWTGNPALLTTQRGTRFSVQTFENLGLAMRMHISMWVPVLEGATETIQGVGMGIFQGLERLQRVLASSKAISSKASSLSYLSLSLTEVVSSPGVLTWEEPRKHYSYTCQGYWRVGPLPMAADQAMGI